MKALTVRCNECGTPLEASDSVRYLTCGNCGAQLSVMRISSSVFTEKLEATGNAEMVRIQNDIVQLDYLWELERQKYLVRFKRSYYEPGLFDFVIWTVFALLGLNFIRGSTGPRGGALDVIFGILIASFSIARVVDSVQKAARLKAGRSIYEAKRKAVRAALVEHRE